jgi:mono/diheme cytochrome c family protein
MRARSWFCAPRQPPAKRRPQAPADIVARGKTLTDAADCATCHTADPAKPFAGGKRIDTPFGGIYSPDLTPDRDTGLGAWSDEEFYRALHDGVARDGSRYYPAFPYPNFTKITGEDVLAIRAYLATLTPFRNLWQPPQLRWPLNYRLVMHGWNFLFFRPGTFAANPQKSDEWNRGAYLVEGAAHCGGCHTPKNIFGADKRGQLYGGGLVQGWFAPPGWTAQSAAD